MYRKILVATVTALLTLTACGSEFEPTSPDEVEGTTTSTLKAKKDSTPSTRKAKRATTASYATLTTDAHDVSVEPTWKTSFAILDTWGVQIASAVPATLTGSHSLNVYVYSPSGALYQSFSIPFAAGTTAGAGEQQAESTASGFRIWAELPVKGTFIDSYNMIGNWRAESWIDGVGPSSSAGFQLQ